MTDIKIVTGANYGDEGKGLVANAVGLPTSLYILSSSSCQRAHTVCHNGKRIVFRHFGSGTIKGAATYFGRKFYINPSMFRLEYEALYREGITPTVYCHADCAMVTPMDMFSNIMKEKVRGSSSHSSTGCGVWETYMRRKRLLLRGENINDIQTVIDYYKDELSKIDDPSIPLFLNGDWLKNNVLDDLDFFFNHVVVIHSDKEERELFHSYSFLVFENGQGLLLDDTYSDDIEHNTPAFVGTIQPMIEIIRNFDITSEVSIEALYVTRTYYTRHGKGQIGVIEDCEVEKSVINSKMVDNTNVYNDNQGNLRYGKITADESDMLSKRVHEDIEKLKVLTKMQSSIVITHTNEYWNDYLIENAIADNVYLSDNESTIYLKE